MLSNKEIIKKIKALRETENVTIADIIKCLSEIELGKLYRELGYSSLFTYCVEALGYSEGSAYRRVQAAKCLSTNPEVYELIKTGKLSLCAVSEINKVEKVSVRAEIIQASEGKSKEEVKVLTAVHLPPARPKRESIKPVLVKSPPAPPLFSKPSSAEVKPDKLVYSFAVDMDEELMKLYRQAKEITGHVPASEVLRRALSEFVGKRRTVKRSSVKKNKSSSGRYIPKASRVLVIKRDNGQCSYVSPEGRRCTERHGLQVDHVKPYALGGSNDPDNLRLLCRAHNMLQAEKSFGKARVLSRLKSRG